MKITVSCRCYSLQENSKNSQSTYSDRLHSSFPHNRTTPNPPLPMSSPPSKKISIAEPPKNPWFAMGMNEWVYIYNMIYIYIYLFICIQIHIYIYTHHFKASPASINKWPGNQPGVLMGKTGNFACGDSPGCGDMASIAGCGGLCGCTGGRSHGWSFLGYCWCFRNPAFTSWSW